jgi:hypothetical protein
MSYYCNMNSTLTTASTSKIVLEDNSQYSYSIEPFELTNVLGYVVAVLQEYKFTKYGDSGDQLSFNLYRTKEGNWYEISEVHSSEECNILRSLKRAIDREENGPVKFTLFK